MRILLSKESKSELYNFLKLNETGLLESDQIKANDHLNYLDKRIYLKSFIIKKLSYLHR